MKRFSLRLNTDLYQKLCGLAVREKRSVNGQIDWILSGYITSFEAAQGKISEQENKSGLPP